VEEPLRAGNTHVVDVDIKRYFDAIPHDWFMVLVREHIADGRVLGLIGGLLKQGVIEGTDWQEAKGEGTPQGGVLSPLLANIYRGSVGRADGRTWF
jgi:RNA-directed DNA polymerase